MIPVVVYSKLIQHRVTAFDHALFSLSICTLYNSMIAAQSAKSANIGFRIVSIIDHWSLLRSAASYSLILFMSESNSLIVFCNLLLSDSNWQLNVDTGRLPTHFVIYVHIQLLWLLINSMIWTFCFLLPFQALGPVQCSNVQVQFDGLLLKERVLDEWEVSLCRHCDSFVFARHVVDDTAVSAMVPCLVNPSLMVKL